MQPVIVEQGQTPLILGMPHGGIFVPDDIFARLNDNGKILADTDWHIDQLYDGLVADVTTVKATFHRYVIDANRDPQGVSLYPGQNTTNLCPITDFDGKDIWQPGEEPKSEEPKSEDANSAEITDRINKFHQPYHQALAAEIERVKAIHGYAILFDCHSIRSEIPFLFDDILPTFSIGTNNGQTCNAEIEKLAQDICRAAPNHASVLNGRFKGGWTTRHYGRPKNNIHAIQLELTQSAYMQEKPPWNYLHKTAANLRPHLAKLLNGLIKLPILSTKQSAAHNMPERK